MRREIAKFVEECPTCQKVKADRRQLAGELQPLPVPLRKLDDITMDFISGLPRASEGMDSIWVIVDRFTKVARFIAVNTTYPVEKYTDIFIREYVRAFGVPRTITSDRDSRFLSHLWRNIMRAMGTKL